MGKHCELRHALPAQADEDRLTFGAGPDLFGRARQPVSFTSAFDPATCQTIHVRSGIPPGSQIERRGYLEEGLGEWGGSIVKVWHVANEGEAYVRFKWRSTAQMVLEAMNGRPLLPDGNEPLVLAWCTTDPNHVQAQQGREMALHAMREARERREQQQQLYQSLEREVAVGRACLADAPRKPLKRPRTEAGNASTADGCASADAPTWVETEEQPITAVAATYPGGDPASLPLTDEVEVGAARGAREAADATAAEEPGLPAGWGTGIDPRSGVVYFFNVARGVTQWQSPSVE
jgi:hypothetical protein